MAAAIVEAARRAAFPWLYGETTTTITTAAEPDWLPDVMPVRA